MSGQPLIDWGWIGGHLDDVWALTVEHLVLAFLAVAHRLRDLVRARRS